MQTDLHQFLFRFIGAVVLALAPVVFTAVVSIPTSLNLDRGSIAQVDAPPRHMT
jgi:hypothetical protein